MSIGHTRPTGNAEGPPGIVNLPGGTASVQAVCFPQDVQCLRDTDIAKRGTFASLAASWNFDQIRWHDDTAGGRMIHPPG